MLAVESNDDLKTITINQVTSSGLSYLVPYVQAFKNNNQGASQTISIQVDQNNGQKLLKVIMLHITQMKTKILCMIMPIT